MKRFLKAWSRILCGEYGMKLKCPICGLDVEVPDDVLPGEVIEHECGTTLEVVKSSDNSYQLKPLEGISEDWGE